MACSIASHLGVRTALWIMLSGVPLSALVLLTGPFRHLRELPSVETGPEAHTGQDSVGHTLAHMPNAALAGDGVSGPR